ncbi:MAG: hypothetical protein QXT28_11720 [Thermofilaceae archaeon]
MSEDRLRYLEKIGEIVQRIVNPPQHSENYQKWAESIAIVKQLSDLAKDIALQDAALKGMTAAIEDLHEKTKMLTVAVILSYAFTLIVGLLIFLFK